MSHPLRVVLVAVGSAGDVAPFVTVGRELTRRGHQVTLVALPVYRALLAKSGLRFAPIAVSDTTTLWPGNHLATTIMLAQPAAMLAAMVHRLRSLAEPTNEAILAASHGADVIVSGLVTADASRMLAARRGVSSVQVLFAPLLPSHQAAATSLARPSTPPKLAWTTSSAMWQLTRLLSSHHTNNMAGRLRATKPSGLGPTLLATSPVLCPPAPEWPTQVHQTGWVPSVTNARQRLPRDLHDFLEAGDPPALMTFGSCPVVSERADLALFRESARRAGVRLLVQQIASSSRRWGSREFICGSVDHNLLLPRVSAVVHHGGAGTTYAALAAGRPSVVVSHLGDQSYYGRRLADLGAGSGPIPRWRATARLVSRHLQRVLSPQVLDTAAQLGKELRAEDGLTPIVDQIERAT